MKTASAAVFVCVMFIACSPRSGLSALPSAAQATTSIGHDTSEQFRTIFVFNGADGSGSQAALIYFKGSLYGTTSRGGDWSTDGGTAFVVTTGGKQRVLHNFGQGHDGRGPSASLVALGDTLYGTTEYGGAYDDGTVFSIAPSGREKILHSFGKGKDGASPMSGLIALNGKLYGTTKNGGANGGGTVFALSAAGSERILHSFGRVDYVGDGSEPVGGLIAQDGLLYGTTSGGGDCPPSGGYPWFEGTVFSVSTGGKERVIHTFGCDNVDGYTPEAGLVGVKHVLYGTTEYGGQHQIDHGTVFRVTLDGTERVLFTFTAQANGWNPVSALVFRSGLLYGTTSDGGKDNFGTVFTLTESGKEHVLHSFGGKSAGRNPLAGLTDVGGTLYGTTNAGAGFDDAGTVFRIAP
jgi:uncharacterized repeat protein (TIGR03803 family)